MTHDELARLDAAYVLGALDPEERQLFEEHLAGCSACARAVEELQGVPRLLGHVDEEVFRTGSAGPAVPDTLLPRLLREVRRRRRRRRAWLAAGAAAAVVLTVVGVGVLDGSEDPPDQVAAAPAAESMEQVGQDVVSATLAMEEVPWGTRLELRCSYDAPAPGYTDPGGQGGAGAPSYALAVQTRDGSWEQVATWRAVPGRTITLAAATAAPADDIASVEVRSLSGDTLLELDS